MAGICEEIDTPPECIDIDLSYWEPKIHLAQSPETIDLCDTDDDDPGDSDDKESATQYRKKHWKLRVNFHLLFLYFPFPWLLNNTVYHDTISNNIQWKHDKTSDSLVIAKFLFHWVYI